MNVQNITLKTKNGEYYAEITGRTNNSHNEVYVRSVTPNSYTLEVRLEEQRKPSSQGQFVTQVTGGYRVYARLGGLPPGRYAVRVNGNNDWVEWFSC